MEKATLRQRHELFFERRVEAKRQMAELRKAIEKLDYKCRYYETVLAAGTLRMFRERNVQQAHHVARSVDRSFDDKTSERSGVFMGFFEQGDVVRA